MRRNRIIWGITWLIALISITFFGGAISYGFFIAISAIPIVSLLYLFYVYSFFHIFQELGTRTVVANQTVPFYFRLVNEYLFAFVGVRIRFYSSFSKIKGLSDETEYELLPKTQIKKETSIICKYRGRYRVGIKTVEIQDFFRLFRISYHNKEPLNVIVNPELIYVDSVKGVEINNIINESKTSATELDVLTRAYVPGDDIRQIHWALSAKSGELMTREKIGQEQQGIGIILDTMRYSSIDLEYLPVENKMLETVLALALFMTQKGVMTREYHLDKTLSFNTVERINQFDDFYRMVSNISFEDGKTQSLLFQELMKRYDIFNCHAILMVLHSWTSEAKEMVALLSRNNVAVIIYLVAKEVPEYTGIDQMVRVNLIHVNPDDDIREVI